MKIINRLVITVGMLLSVSHVLAATINQTGNEATTVGNCSLEITGEIKVGDAAKLDRIFSSIEDKLTDYLQWTGEDYIACISGQGGDFPEAVKIAKLLMDRYITTSVPEDSICSSACAIMFLGGRDCCVEFGLPITKRHLARGSKLGFSAPSLDTKVDSFTASEVAETFKQSLDVIAQLQDQAEILDISDDIINHILNHRNDSIFWIEPDPKHEHNYVDLNGSIFQDVWVPGVSGVVKQGTQDQPSVKDKVELDKIPESVKVDFFHAHNVERVGTADRLYMTHYSNKRRSAIFDLTTPDKIDFYRLPDYWHAKGASTHVSRDGKYLAAAAQIAKRAAGTNDLHAMGHLVVSSIETKEEVWKHNIAPGFATLATLSHDNTLLAATVMGNNSSNRREIFKISLFKVGQQNPIGTFYGHNDHATSLIFTQDSKRLISTSTDGKTRVWDVESQDLLLELDGTSNGASYDSISPDGRYFATANRAPRVWDLSSGEMVYELNHKADIAQFTPDGDKLLIFSRRFKTLKIVNLKSKEILLELNDITLISGALILPKSQRLVYSLINEIKVMDISHLLGNSNR